MGRHSSSLDLAIAHGIVVKLPLDPGWDVPSKHLGEFENDTSLSAATASIPIEHIAKAKKQGVPEEIAKSA